MNLNKLFEKQRELDARILLEKGLVGQELLDKKILALQVELGELANEWRGFKFWSEDQEPITKVDCNKFNCDSGVVHHYFGNGVVDVTECTACKGTNYVNPLLEEYVDCLHLLYKCF